MDVPLLSRARSTQGNRIMSLKKVYRGWQERRLHQSEAVQILGVCDRRFRRYIARYEHGESDMATVLYFLRIPVNAENSQRLNPTIIVNPSRCFSSIFVSARCCAAKS
jgi:hypothetical protein